MITVSLVKELEFISRIYGGKLSCSLHVRDGLPDINICIEKGKLTVFFLNNLIWQESISEASSNFGVESCQTIALIMKKMLNGEKWEDIPHIYA